MIGRTLAILACASGLAVAQQAVAPKLTGDAPAPAERAEPAARALPSVMAICIDRAARRCWSAAGPAGCAPAGGEVFASLPAGSPEIGIRLRDCADSLAR